MKYWRKSTKLTQIFRIDSESPVASIYNGPSIKKMVRDEVYREINLFNLHKNSGNGRSLGKLR